MTQNTNMESIRFNLAIDRQKEFKAAKKRWLQIRQRMLTMCAIISIVEVFAMYMYTKGCIEVNPQWGSFEVGLCVSLCVFLFVASWFWFTRTYFTIQRAILGRFKK